MFLYAFDARLLDVWLDPAPETSRVDDVHLATAGEVLARRRDVAAVLDGAMFACGDPAHPGYRDMRFAVPQYAALAASGLELPGDPKRDALGLTIGVVGGKPAVLDGDGVAALRALGATVAVQGWPTLVRAGVVVDQKGKNAAVTQRAALCVLADGRLAFAVHAAGMQDFAAALVARGVTDAVYTDGGGSARIQLADGRWYGSSENRRVAMWILARKVSP